MNKIFDIVFPMVADYRVNKKLQKKLNSEGADDRITGKLPSISNSSKISTQTLEEQYNNTIDIKNKLEDKAKTNIIGITISITLIMGASNLLNAINNKYSIHYLNWIAFVIFTMSVVYMFFGGILAIKVLTVENEVYIIELAKYAENETELRKAYDESTAYNNIKNIIRNNRVYSSYECIRNALICLLFVLVLSTLPLRGSSDNINVDISSCVQNQNDYVFMFSPETVSYMNNLDILNDVENSIIQMINKTKTNNISSIGFLDESHNIYIKYVVHDNIIDVLLVEPYIIP